MIKVIFMNDPPRGDKEMDVIPQKIEQIVQVNTTKYRQEKNATAELNIGEDAGKRQESDI